LLVGWSNNILPNDMRFWKDHKNDNEWLWKKISSAVVTIYKEEWNFKWLLKKSNEDRISFFFICEDITSSVQLFQCMYILCNTYHDRCGNSFFFYVNSFDWYWRPLFIKILFYVLKIIFERSFIFYFLIRIIFIFQIFNQIK